ncbi:aryl-alcohol dehydrogenase [Apiospora marii]|uniref:Aryl-alcohol dehydrogenase n=1 Tax=Apiospora marii TaxID=335849 RepID=A0ABR1STJ8_9PEZI
MSFNYIIVGGGTAGMVVATRLSKDPNVTVLVLEAGADKSSDPAVLTPGLFSTQIGKPEYDWMFRSTRQAHLNDRIIAQPRGKQLGGTSAMNIMVIMHPTRANLDAWGALGNEGWSFDELAPYYRKMSTVTPPGPNARDVVQVDKWHDPVLDGDSGPLRIGWGNDYPESLHGAWVKTFDHLLGRGMTGDPRNGEAVGGFQNMESVSPDTRCRSYAANAYYGPEERARPNLTVMTDTLVVRIATKQTPSGIVAIGVHVRMPDGEEQYFDAIDEVVLCAGTIQSPQILELSGIGGRALLEQHSIPVMVDNPNVGENLQDHPIVGQIFEVKEGVRSLDLLKDPGYAETAMEEFSKQGTGILSQGPVTSAYTPFVDKDGVMPEAEVKALFDEYLGSKRNTAHDATDHELQLLRNSMEKPGSNQVQYHLLPASLPVQDPNGISPVFDQPQVAVMAILSHPFGRGHVHISSSSITDPPMLDPRYLVHPLDMEILARSVQFTERIRYPDFPHADVSLDRAKEIVRQVAFSCYHPAGTCGMRPREARGVVDARLVVHGTTNLRVVDASVFPLMPSGNIQATVYAVAERAADFIKEALAERRRASAAGGGDNGSTDSAGGSTVGSVDEDGSGGTSVHGDSSMDGKGSNASA